MIIFRLYNYFTFYLRYCYFDFCVICKRIDQYHLCTSILIILILICCYSFLPIVTNNVLIVLIFSVITWASYYDSHISYSLWYYLMIDNNNGLNILILTVIIYDIYFMITTKWIKYWYFWNKCSSSISFHN